MSTCAGDNVNISTRIYYCHKLCLQFSLSKMSAVDARSFVCVSVSTRLQKKHITSIFTHCNSSQEILELCNQLSQPVKHELFCVLIIIFLTVVMEPANCVIIIKQTKINKTQRIYWMKATRRSFTWYGLDGAIFFSIRQIAQCLQFGATGSFSSQAGKVAFFPCNKIERRKTELGSIDLNCTAN